MTERRLLIIAVVAFVALAGGAFFGTRQFLLSYLFGYLFWLGIALGSLALIMLHDLTGGRWGSAIRGPLAAAVATIPLLAILFIPLALGVSVLYPWTHATSAMVRGKSAYLNVPFFIVRAVLYFSCWTILAVGFVRRRARFAPWAGGGLVLYAITMTFASWDWMMSLEPQWWSTIYGMIVLTGQGLSAMALMIIFAAFAWRPDEELIDLGNLLLTFIIFWAYCAFSQFLLIWSGNIKDEIAWYLPRIHTSWVWLGGAIVVFYFFAPFLALLSRVVKRNNWLVAIVAGGVLLMHLVDLFWTVAPALHPRHFVMSWMDVVAPIAVGGVWMFAFKRRMRTGRPVAEVAHG